MFIQQRFSQLRVITTKETQSTTLRVFVERKLYLKSQTIRGTAELAEVSNCKEQCFIEAAAVAVVVCTADATPLQPLLTAIGAALKHLYSHT